MDNSAPIINDNPIPGAKDDTTDRLDDVIGMINMEKTRLEKVIAACDEVKKQAMDKMIEKNRSIQLLSDNKNNKEMLEALEKELNSNMKMKNCSISASLVQTPSLNLPNRYRDQVVLNLDLGKSDNCPPGLLVASHVFQDVFKDTLESNKSHVKLSAPYKGALTVISSEDSIVKPSGFPALSSKFMATCLDQKSNKET